MITRVRRCVACDDLWPWPISSGSFDLDFENRVRSVTFSVLDRLFPYLPQIITTIRGCVAFSVYNKILKFQFFTNFSNVSAFHLKKNLQFCLHSCYIWRGRGYLKRWHRLIYLVKPLFDLDFGREITSHIYVDVITYPKHNRSACLLNLCL